MSSPFLAEIRIFGFNFPPKGWAMCNGQLLPISQNTALFSLLGTQYGGNGTSNFGLPNLQGMHPMHQGQGPGLSQRFIGETGGEPTVALLTTEIPVHGHAVNAVSNPATPAPSQSPSLKGIAASAAKPYDPGPANSQLAQLAVGVTGSGLPHNNLSPYLVLTFCIAMQGIFPSRN